MAIADMGDPEFESVMAIDLLLCGVEWTGEES
jgi:hypothetical protein